MSSDGFEFDDIDLGEIDAIESHYTLGTALPPRTAVNRPGLVQRDLFGAAVVVPAQPPPTKPFPAGGGGGGGSSRTITIGGGRANQSGSGGGGGGGSGFEPTRAKTKVTKKWDPAAFAKHGWSKKNAAVTKAKAKGKGKGKQQRAYASDEDAWDEEEVLDDDEDDDDDGQEELLDTTYDPKAPILPIKWPPDREASKSFVYPVQPDKPLRTYQYNIVTSALYKNTLVSLPTGLGKTFIAACVMLNFYRWYPKGKVLFLAPTRPLVTQQIKACHYIAGIPQEDCIELTGGTIPKLRSLGWATKRVIYSTPQTVERDLAKGRLDPRDVTLVVVDEAHRASGDYSYCGVIRYMMCRNPHFRVLALTATPGSRGEAVQEVIDNLHIGHIEVRADDSFDIRQYVHKKSFDLTVLPLGPALSALRDKWAGLMRPYIGPLLEKRLIYSGDAVMLSPFVVQQAYQKIKTLPGGGKGNGQYFPMIKTLGQMCRAMEYLVIQSVTSFESSIKDIEANGAKKLVQSSGFRQVASEVAAIRGREGYVGHPKMEKLREMCLEHFEATKDDVDEYTGEKRETRVMIFCNFRAVVEEIVDCLNTQRPLIKATPFVGQASSKGTKGKSQKEQLETIKKFKKGVYNVLVATSIGEEGLDIGEIDLIICYEANKSPIRMLQRVGRTGRARDGHIIVLMSEGREERNWDRANDAYQEVQNALTSNKIFELYADCERLLPDDVKPVCEKVEIKALPLNVDAMTMNGQSKAERKHLAEEKKKGKTVRNPRANMPEDAFDGFRTAGQLAVASKLKPLSATQTVRERKADALLTTEQEEQLRSRWMYDVSGEPIIPQRFFIDELPFEQGTSGSAHGITSHGQRHLDLVLALRTNDQLADGNRRALDTWTDSLSRAFKPNLIDVYKRGDDDPLPRPHPRLRRIRPPEDELEVPPALMFPALTGYPIPQHATSSGSSTVSAAHDEPLFRPYSPRTSPQKRLSRPASPRRPSPARKRVKTSASTPEEGANDKNNATTETIDLSGILSSDDENLVALREDSRPHQPRGHASVAGSGPSSTSYSIVLDELDDDIAMDWSDSELLKGAVIRGKSGSISPRPRGKDAIVIDDSEDDVGLLSQPQRSPNVSAPLAPRKPPPVSVVASLKPELAAGPAPSRTVSATSFERKVATARQDSSLALARTKSAPHVRGGIGVAFKPFVPPRPSRSQPPTSSPQFAPSHARVSSPPPRSSPPVLVLDDSPVARPAELPVRDAKGHDMLELAEADDADDDDEYGTFDFPSQAFDELNISQIPTANIRGRPIAHATSTGQVAPATLEDDSVIMPPPPPSVKRRPAADRVATTGRSTLASNRKLVVPASSSSAAAAPSPHRSRHPQPPASLLSSSSSSASSPNNTGFRPAKTLLPPELVNAAKSKTKGTRTATGAAAAATTATNSVSAGPPAPMRRLAVPDSSSPGGVVDPGTRARTGGGAGAGLVRKHGLVLRTPTEELDDERDARHVEIVSGTSDEPCGKVLNRLRRGGGGRAAAEGGAKPRVVVDSDVDAEVVASNEEASKKNDRRQKNKKTKPILTHKAAAKFGIFDTEAINSEAEGSEASSESYDSENSIDRDFVARDEDDDDDEASHGRTFYRDSLNTQYDAARDGDGDGARAGRGPVFATEPEWVRKRNRWADPDNWGKHREHDRRASVQDTPRSQEPSQWSYDSFCVPDDDEIEYEQSQEDGGYSSPV